LAFQLESGMRQILPDCHIAILLAAASTGWAPFVWTDFPRANERKALFGRIFGFLAVSATFRQGHQHNLLVRDKQTEIYRNALTSLKQRLFAAACLHVCKGEVIDELLFSGDIRPYLKNSFDVKSVSDSRSDADLAVRAYQSQGRGSI
jgi:hypothetical protein